MMQQIGSELLPLSEIIKGNMLNESDVLNELIFKLFTDLSIGKYSKYNPAEGILDRILIRLFLGPADSYTSRTFTCEGNTSVNKINTMRSGLGKLP